jgi:hypothetical protein
MPGRAVDFLRPSGRWDVASQRVARAGAWSPTAAALVFLAVLGWSMPWVLTAVNWNSDVVSPMVLAQSLPSAPAHAIVYLGNSAPYTTLWFDELTLHLPLHRGVWVASPYVLASCGLLLLTWAASRVGGRWVAMLTFVIAVSTGPTVVYPLVSQGVHLPTDVNVILLVALLVVAEGCVTARQWRRVLLLALPIAVITGADIGSDALLLVAGALPVLGAPLLLWLRSRERHHALVSLLSLGTTLLALAVAALTTMVADHQGLRLLRPAPHFATTTQLGDNIKLLGLIVLDMGNGLVFGMRLTTTTALAGISGAFAAAAFIITLLMLRHSPADAERSADGPRSALPIYVLFWALVQAASVGAFVLSDVPVDGGAIRYLIPVFYAMAAVIPIWARRSEARRVGTALAVTLYAGVAAQTLHASVVAHGFESSANKGTPPVIALLRAHHLNHGYAGYWEANSVTWKSGGQVQPRAVLEGSACGAPDPGVLCAYRFNALSSWFTPQPGPSFLLVGLDDPYVSAAPSGALGSPSAVYRIGQFTVYVYPYDLASAFRS